MKKLLVLLLLLVIPFFSFERTIDGIEDGWYRATVVYFNTSTYTRSTYTLNVKVEWDRVVAIDFGNGGSVHSGYNSSGYIYGGGYLYFSRDYDYNIISATATVTVTDGSDYSTFNITIE
jgi:hypothetical protein